MEDTLSKFMSESAKRYEENSNLIKDIRAVTDAAIRNQGTSFKNLEIQIGQMSKSRQTTVPFPSHLDNHYCEEEEGNYGPKFVEAYGASHINDTIPRKEKDPGSFTLPCYINNICFDNALVDLRASVSVMPLLTYLNLGLGELAHTRLTVELADRTVKYPKGIAKNVLVGIGKFTFPVDFIILDMPEDIKVPLILGRPFLSTARAKIDVYKRNISLSVGEERIVFTSVKPASSLIKRVYMLSLRERMELDLETRLMGETLVLNRSLDPFLEDYIELNDLNKPFELRRNQGDDLIPTIEECEVIEEFITRYDELDIGIDDYPSYCDYDKKIHIDCAYYLKFSCMIGFEFTHANFFPLLYQDRNAHVFPMFNTVPRERNIDEVGGMDIFWNSVRINSEDSTYTCPALTKPRNEVNTRIQRDSLSSIQDFNRRSTFTANTPYPEALIRRIFLSQRKYAVEILERAHMVHCNPSQTPVNTESKLGDDGDHVSDPTLYRSLEGSLHYLTFTRPNISYAVQQVRLYMHNTWEPHLSALKRILRYVRDWAGCPKTQRSTSGYYVFLGNNLLSWSSKRQPTLSRSIAEAEYRGVVNVVAETCWLWNLLCELHTPLSSATLVYCDNVILDRFEFYISLLVISMRTYSLKDSLRLCLRSFLPV
ncbi:hypothetical protein Tco_0533121 [Tanacetum coccineum]